MLQEVNGFVTYRETIALTSGGSVVITDHPVFAGSDATFTGQATPAELATVDTAVTGADPKTLPTFIVPSAPASPLAPSLVIDTTITATDYVTTLQAERDYGGYAPRLQPLVDAVNAIRNRVVLVTQPTAVTGTAGFTPNGVSVGNYTVDAPISLTLVIASAFGRQVTVHGNVTGNTIAVSSVDATAKATFSLRSSPSPDASSIATVEQGDTFHVTGSSGWYLHVETASGVTGWAFVGFAVVGFQQLTASIAQLTDTPLPPLSSTTLDVDSGTLRAGDTTTLHATVTGSGATGAPTGRVEFKEDGRSIGTVALQDGKADLEITPPAGSHTYTAEYGGDTTYAGSISGTTTVVVKVGPQLQVTKEPVGSTVDSGSTAQFRITVTNVGDDTADGVRLTDELDARLFWRVAGGDGCTTTVLGSGGQELGCDVGSLGPGASYTATVAATVTYDVCGDIPNLATATSANAGTATSPVAHQKVIHCPLTVTKTAAQPTVETRDLDTYTMTISNPNDEAVDLTLVDDKLPPGARYEEGSTTGASTNDPSVINHHADGDVLGWSGPVTVPAHGTVSVSFSVRMPSTAGTYVDQLAGADAVSPYIVIPATNTAPVTVVGNDQLVPDVLGFALVDTSTGRPVPGYERISDSQTLDVATLPPGFTIVALTDPPGEGTVGFSVDGAAARTDRKDPFSVTGTATRPWRVQLGPHTITATPAAEDGTAGTPVTLNLTLTDGRLDGAAVTSVSLVSAIDGSTVGRLTDNAVVDIGKIGTRDITLAAGVNNPGIGSVVFSLTSADGTQQKVYVDSTQPFVARGEPLGWAAHVDPGGYVLTVTPYSGAHGHGVALGSITLHFSAIDLRDRPCDAAQVDIFRQQFIAAAKGFSDPIFFTGTLNNLTFGPKCDEWADFMVSWLIESGWKAAGVTVEKALYAPGSIFAHVLVRVTMPAGTVLYLDPWRNGPANGVYTQEDYEGRYGVPDDVFKF